MGEPVPGRHDAEHPVGQTSKVRKGHWINILPLVLAAALLLAAADSTPITGVTTAPKKKSTSTVSSKAPPAKSKAAPSSKTAPAKSASTPSTAVTPAKSGSTKKSTSKKKSTAARKPVTPSWRASQRAPAPERYKEIQQALASKGYLHEDAPSGVWDGASVDALKKFQQDQSLEPSGKLDSLSIIALGLGPKHDAAPVVPAPAPAPDPTP